MNGNTTSQPAAEQDKPQFLNLISNSASAALAMVLLALGLLVPCAKAQTALSGADINFILAAAQGGMTEVKLGELASTSGVRDDVKS